MALTSRELVYIVAMGWLVYFGLAAYASQLPRPICCVRDAFSQQIDAEYELKHPGYLEALNANQKACDHEFGQGLRFFRQALVSATSSLPFFLWLTW